jgi:hypothetical protein
MCVFAAEGIRIALPTDDADALLQQQQQQQQSALRDGAAADPDQVDGTILEDAAGDTSDNSDYGDDGDAGAGRSADSHGLRAARLLDSSDDEEGTCESEMQCKRTNDSHE